MKPLRTKLEVHGVIYKAVIERPEPGAEVRLFCDETWIGVGRVKKFPDCKITGAVRNAYGKTMRRILKRLGKRLTKKAEKRLAKKL